ncbi:MAG: hypothetical protein WA858_09445 [Xanthobacteraceae bacterium]|jgi:hypothetical protein
MAADDPPPNAGPPLRARRWSIPRPPPPNKSNRMLFRLIGLPALAFAGVLIYRGVQERFILPACDSSRAKSTLNELLDQLKAGPLQEDAIKTVSTSKQQVVCNVAVQKSDGGTVELNYTFFWQGNSAEMRYSISLKPAQNPPATPQQQVPLR